MNKSLRCLAAASTALALTACSSTMKMPAAPMKINAPEAVTPPVGHTAVLWTVGKGELTYECRAKADKSGHEWALLSPMATLWDNQQKVVGKYYAGPTWEAADGSKLTGKQVAVSPVAGSIPLQLVKAEPAMGAGRMTGISYVQRLNTQGGLVPAGEICDANRVAGKTQVTYQADYVFYQPAM